MSTKKDSVKAQKTINNETAETTVQPTAAEATTEAQSPQEYRPRVQNRRCSIALWPQKMSDGKTTRVIQVFDAMVPFGVHPEMIKTLNQFRKDVFGDDGNLYETKNVPLPTEGVVHVLVLNTKSGKIIAHKVFEAAEADAYMTKVRKDIEASKAAYRERFAANTSNAEFGSPIQEAMNAAKEKRDAAAAAN